MNKTWRWMALGAAAVVLAAAVLLWANNSFAGGRGASPAPNLANTNWTLVSINGQAPIAGRALTLSLQSGSHLGDDSGCNSYGGQYQINGGRMAVTQLMSTLRACTEQPLNDQEAVFQKVLSDAAEISVAGNQLMIQNASGRVVLAFHKQ